MTYKEALNFNQNWTAEQAKNDLERYLLRGENPACKAVALGMQALEKQIPKKPIVKKSKTVDYEFKYYHCPICGRHFLSKIVNRVVKGTKPHNCYDCGQALDWSDTE